MLTDDDKKYIKEIHTLVDTMEKLEISEKIIEQVISEKWLCFSYEPNQNFKYVGSIKEKELI